MHHHDPALIMLGQLGFVLTCGTAVAVMPSLVVETTPRAVRCTVIATAYNVSYGIVGGLSPLAATWLVERSGVDLSPALIVMMAAVISFIALQTFPATGRAQAANAALAK